MPKITVLTKELAELIAAGEVIERPSSIVKELIENSIDSGANSLTIEMKQGGITFLRVTDNGCGIPQEDVPTAFLRHATSKIRTKEDLSGIYTLGFRGEALASVSAVAKVEVLTRTSDCAYGTHYVIEGTEEKTFEQAGCPFGTTIIVRDIFYNVPARLKFLKKDVYEGNAISSIVSKIALSHPEVSIKLIRDNRQELFTPGDGDLYSAVYAVLGREYAAAMLDVDYRMSGVKVTGFTSKPIIGRPDRKMQMFYINGRYVRSFTCMSALEEAYKNSIMTGKFPSCVLKLEVSPETLDVNVHPTKTEVRFTNEKCVYDAVYFAVKNTLLLNNAPNELNVPQPRIDYTAHHEAPAPVEQLRMADIPAHNVSAPPHGYELDENAEASNENALDMPSERAAEPSVAAAVDEAAVSEAVSEEIKLSRNALAEDFKELNVSGQVISEFRHLSAESFAVKKPEPPPKPASPEPEASAAAHNLKYIGEAFMNYIIAEADGDLVIVDKHAAHERIIYEEIKAKQGSLEAQLLLEPVSVMLDYEEYSAVSSRLDMLKELGFDIELSEPRSLLVSGVPTILDGADPSDIVIETARNIAQNRQNPMPELLDDIYHTVACKAAIKANDKNSPRELMALLESIYSNDNIRYCPHGRPIIFKLTKRDLEKQFKRIQ